MSDASEIGPRRRRRRARRFSAEELRRSLELFRSFVVECQACQSENPPHWQYCAQCGSRLATACPGCGNPLPPLGARYCPYCGVELPRGEPRA